MTRARWSIHPPPNALGSYVWVSASGFAGREEYITRVVQSDYDFPEEHSVDVLYFQEPLDAPSLTAEELEGLRGEVVS